MNSNYLKASIYDGTHNTRIKIPINILEKQTAEVSSGDAHANKSAGWTNNISMTSLIYAK